MRCAHFSPNTLYPLRGGARLLCMVWKMRCAFLTLYTLHPLRGGARLLECMVWKMRTARFFSHHTLSILYVARSPSMYSVRNALRAFLTLYTLSLARRARLLECMVWKMRCAFLTLYTLHPLRGAAI